eukprot:COSAG01_NODE_10021_length_2273_cov_4.055198_2_plen_97_part_00
MASALQKKKQKSKKQEKKQEKKKKFHAYNPTYALSSDEYHRRGDEKANAEVAKLVRSPEFKEWEARRFGSKRLDCVTKQGRPSYSGAKSDQVQGGG